MSRPVRIAAAGDIHCSEPLREHITHAFAAVAESAELILLAGDLTTHGEPEQAVVLADACRALQIPVVAVLGNHDYQ
jgi:predicted MPP superfamily phosphohydrolase